MSQKTRSVLSTEIDNSIYTNVTQDIEGDELNTILKDQNDSYANLISDKLLFNLRNYSTTRGTYEVGEYAVQAGILYECINATSGAFNPAHWNAISGGSFVDLTTNQTVGGEKTFTDNLIVAANFLPDVDGNLDIGSASFRFNNGHIDRIFGSSLDKETAGALDLGGVTATVVNVGVAAANTQVNIGTAGTNVITIGNSNSTVNILGTVLYEDVTNLQVRDKLITLNKGGAAASATGTGVEFEENNVITGYIKTTGGRDGFLFKSPANAADSSFIFTATSARSYTFPDSSGTVFFLPALTSGSILFSDGTTISQDNANAFWDNSNKIAYFGANSGAFTNTRIHATGTLTSYLQNNTRNLSSNAAASGDFVVTADDGSDTDKFGDFGINSSGWSGTGVLDSARTVYLYSKNVPLSIGIDGANDLKIFTGGTAAANERMRIASDGKGYFNTTSLNATAFGVFRFLQGTGRIDIGESSTGYGTIWMNASATPTGSNYTIRSNGNTVNILAGSDINLTSGTSGTSVVILGGRFSFAPRAESGQSNSKFLFTTPADLLVTAGTEQIGYEIDMSTNTIQHASNTGITLNRDSIIKARSHRFVTSTGTITKAVTTSITGAPIVSTNAAITTAIALEIEGGNTNGASLGYGLFVNATAGASTNWAMGVLGNAQFQNLIYVGAAGVTPTSYVHIAAGTTSSAAIELTAGTNLTTARAGAFEYDGTNLFFTRVGTTRESVLSGVSNAVSPTAPDRTITVNVAGTTLYIHAKTTND